MLFVLEISQSCGKFACAVHLMLIIDGAADMAIRLQDLALLWLFAHPTSASGRCPRYKLK